MTRRRSDPYAGMEPLFTVDEVTQEAEPEPTRAAAVPAPGADTTGEAGPEPKDELAAHVRAVVDRMGPLSPAQGDLLALLFRRSA